MVSVEQARETTLRLTPVLPGELASVGEALGRALAEDVYAGESLPPFAASAVDGYAVVAADGTAGRRVLAEITAGRAGATPLEPGTAMSIMTGAPLPPGADAVAMVEDTAEADGRLTLERPVRAGENVIPVGLDVAAGQLVLPRGATVGPAEAALLSTIGRVQVQVHRAPVVAVLSTGDELVEPGEAIAGGMIRDSNRYGLLAAVSEAGGRPVSLGIARDDLSEQEQRIRSGLRDADVLLTSGGVSVGSRDLIKPILERLGEVHFGRVAIKPGKPLTFATVGDKLVFGLPGFPVSSLVTFELFVRPTLLKMRGQGVVSRPRSPVTLEHEVARTPDRVEFQRAHVRREGHRLLARSTGLQASSRLLSLVGANALLRIPPGTGTIAAGEEVEALLIGPWE